MDEHMDEHNALCALNLESVPKAPNLTGLLAYYYV